MPVLFVHSVSMSIASIATFSRSPGVHRRKLDFIIFSTTSSAYTEHHPHCAFFVQCHNHATATLVGGGIRVVGRREADTGVGSVEDRIEPLEERVPVDEVQARARVTANVVDDEVDVISAAANRGVQRARPDLSVRRETVGRLQNRFQHQDASGERQDAPRQCRS